MMEVKRLMLSFRLLYHVLVLALLCCWCLCSLDEAIVLHNPRPLCFIVMCLSLLQVPVTEINGEDHHDHHSARITCHMCYIVEVGKSERAKMLPCKCCGKKYHRTCLMSWAQHRGIFFFIGESVICLWFFFLDSYCVFFFFLLADLFDWSSWACPYCRTCEVSFAQKWCHGFDHFLVILLRVYTIG